MAKKPDSFSKDISKIQFGILLISLVSLVVSFNPQWHVWGLDSLRSFPVGLRIALLLLLALTVVPKIQSSIGEKLAEWFTSLSSGATAGLYFTAAVILLTLFVLMSSNNHLLGDGYLVLSNLAGGKSEASFESLTNLFAHVVYGFTRGDEQGALLTYRIEAYVAGAVFLGSLWYYAENKAGVWLSLVLSLSFAVMQFFAGYAENYTLSFLFMFLYLMSAQQDLHKQRLSIQTIVFLLVAIALHLQVGVLLPSLVYLAYSRWRSTTVLVLCIAFSLVMLVGAVIYSVSIAKLELIFVPLLPTSATPYSLFCIEHLRDLLNLFLLNYPLALIMLLTVSFRRMKFGMFHLLSIPGTLLFTIMTDPKMGAIRDWDLMSVASASLIVATINALQGQSRSHSREAWRLFAPLLLFAIIHTGSWIWQNTSAKDTYGYIKSVIQIDPHYSERYDRGYRNLSWTQTVTTCYADSTEGIRSMEVRVRAKPGEDKSRYILAALFHAYKHDPTTAARLMSDSWQQLLDAPETIANIGSIFIEAGYLDEAEKMFEAFVAEGGKNAQVFYNLAIRKESKGEFEQAWKHYRASLDMQEKPLLDRRLSFYVLSLLHGHEQEGEAGLRDVAPLLSEPLRLTVSSLLTAVSQHDMTRVDSLCTILMSRK